MIVSASLIPAHSSLPAASAADLGPLGSEVYSVAPENVLLETTNGVRDANGEDADGHAPQRNVFLFVPSVCLHSAWQYSLRDLDARISATSAVIAVSVFCALIVLVARSDEDCEEELVMGRNCALPRAFKVVGS